MLSNTEKKGAETDKLEETSTCAQTFLDAMVTLTAPMSQGRGLLNHLWPSSFSASTFAALSAARFCLPRVHQKHIKKFSILWSSFPDSCLSPDPGQHQSKKELNPRGGGTVETRPLAVAPPVPRGRARPPQFLSQSLCRGHPPSKNGWQA